jgi:hypothetical protein
MCKPAPVLREVWRRRRALQDDRRDGRRQQPGVRDVGPGHEHRQRPSVRLGQEGALHAGLGAVGFGPTRPFHLPWATRACPRDPAAGPGATMASGSVLRMGAVCFVAGLALVVLTTAFHPSGNDPSDSPAAFREYAESATWTAVHAGQFFAVLILTGSFVCLHVSLKDRPGWASALAWLGLAAMIATIATFAALQAVDGVALKFVVDRWATAPPAEQAVAFRVAEAVRWAEIGLNSYFRLLLGATLALYGASIAAGVAYPRWPG